MKIIPIFATPRQNLYCCVYSYEELSSFGELTIEEQKGFVERPELRRLIENWTTPSILKPFFESNKEDLEYFSISIFEAMRKTVDQVEILNTKLLSLEHGELLETWFRNLDDRKIRYGSLDEQKSKQMWLRLYAIRFDRSNYLIVGGAIKLTKEMKDRAHTRTQLRKLKYCEKYLKDNGVFDVDSFFDYCVEI